MTTRKTIGRVPVGRGEYASGNTYYPENSVTMLGMSFRCLQQTGDAPAEVRDGKAALINTDKWQLTAGSPNVYNLAANAADYGSLAVSVENGVELSLQSLDGKVAKVPIPAATTENAGVMSAEDKMRLQNVGQKAINREYTDADLLDVHWNGTMIDKGVNAKGFVVKVPRKSYLSYLNITGDFVSAKAFASYPKVGNADILDIDVIDGYNNTTDKDIYVLFTYISVLTTVPRMLIKVTSSGLFNAIPKASLANVKGFISIETLGTTSPDGIRVAIPDGIIIVRQNKENIQTTQDITVTANGGYVYYLLVDGTNEVYITSNYSLVNDEDGVCLVATITPNAKFPVQGLTSYKYNGMTFELVNEEEIADIRNSIDKHTVEISEIKDNKDNKYAIDSLQGVSYNHNAITPNNVKSAIKSVWFSCPTAGNIEKVLSGVNEVYISTINNKPAGYSPAVYISSEGKDDLFQWYLKSQTEPRTGIETIQLTVNSSFSSQFGLSGYSPLINIVIDWDVFGQNIREDDTGIKIELSKIWRFQRENVTVVESAKSAVANSLIGKTIVCFGDSLTEMTDTTNSLHYSDYISYMTGANVINCGVGGSQLRQRTTPSTTPKDNSQAYAALDIINMIRAACNKDFSMQIAANEYLTTNALDDNSFAINNLKTIDWEKVDAVTIFAGTNDWYTPNTIGDSVSNDVNYTLGSINEIIRLVSSTYPNVKMFFFTPVVRWLDYSESNGVGTSANWSDEYEVSGNGTLKQEAAAIMNEVALNHIPVCDMYNTLGWNKYNFKNYFQGSDGTHPRKLAGVMMIAKKIMSFILANNTL